MTSAGDKTMSTTIENVTDEQIQSLLSEAEAAGDDAQVKICRKALRGDSVSRARCVDAIQYAEAMAR